jgi:DNA-binding MarR family transcriptional regulator
MPNDNKKDGRGAAAGGVDFAILPDLIGYNLRRAEAAMTQDFMRTLRELSITPGQFGVLVLIDANPGLNQTSLGRALGIDRSTVVSVIDKLEARDLVARAPSTRDRRSYALRLSPAGQDLLARARPLVHEHEARLAAAMSADERTQLLDLLRRIGTG